ncbi:hypothetical protein TorRG33x02_267790, partial [Trema orientale]
QGPCPGICFSLLRLGFRESQRSKLFPILLYRSRTTQIQFLFFFFFFQGIFSSFFLVSIGFFLCFSRRLIIIIIFVIIIIFLKKRSCKNGAQSVIEIISQSVRGKV